MGRVGWVIVAALVGWVTLGTVLAIILQILMAAEGFSAESQLVGSGMAALVGMIVGGFPGDRHATRKAGRSTTQPNQNYPNQRTDDVNPAELKQESRDGAPRPGWYPAPDGTGQQWWTGVSWGPRRP